MTSLLRHPCCCEIQAVAVMLLTRHGRCRNSWDCEDSGGLGCSLTAQQLIAAPEEAETSQPHCCHRRHCAAKTSPPLQALSSAGASPEGLPSEERLQRGQQRRHARLRSCCCYYWTVQAARGYSAQARLRKLAVVRQVWPQTLPRLVTLVSLIVIVLNPQNHMVPTQVLPQVA